MAPKLSIRIVKRGQRPSQSSEAEERRAPDNKQTRQSGREVANNVKAWVREFQERRAAEPRKAFAKLFGEPASPLNSLS